MTKPFSIRELQARVKALLRRVEALKAPAGGDAHDVIEAGGLVIHIQRRHVTRGGRPLDLTAKEFDLLLHFARNPGRVFTRSHLLDSVWGHGYEGQEHTVNSHINRLRAKIEDDPAHPRFILTVRGVGYKFTEDAAGGARD
jgi:DNA-binding response OmpR family regulator